MGGTPELMIPLLLLAASLAVLSPPSTASAKLPDPSVSTGYNCSADRSIYPCQSYAFYRAGADPSLLDLSSIGDLFGVSRLSIALASNLSATAALRPGQPLLIPLDCACGAVSNHSYAAVAYQFAAGDTYYAVSTQKLANLTAYPAVIAANPTLIPTDIPVGGMATFPVFCQCPSVHRNATAPAVPGLTPGLVTYVLQPSDTFTNIASNFGTNVSILTAINGPEKSITTYSTIFIPLTQIPPPILLSKNLTATPPPPPPAAAATAAVIERRDRKGLVAGLAAALGVIGILWAVLLLLVLRRRSSRGRVKGDDLGKGAPKRYGRNGSDDKLMADISEWLDKYRVYDIHELMEATSDFDESRLIEGSVYKGVLDGVTYAVKKMKWNARDELKILQKVNHSNLVKLEGFSIEPDEGTCYLVYEYVENGSLDHWLHDPSASYKLNWRTRLRIALDLANGLQYIHEHTWPRVVHKDIKSSNVLLDSKMRAKIANFGLARSGCNAVTTHIVGTQGYIAPEYLIDGMVTTKMDVFAYGVVLLELVSGRVAADEAGDALWMQAEAGGFFGRSDTKLMAWMDPALVDEESSQVESVLSVMNIAKACLNRDLRRGLVWSMLCTLCRGPMISCPICPRPGSLGGVVVFQQGDEWYPVDLYSCCSRNWKSYVRNFYDGRVHQIGQYIYMIYTATDNPSKLGVNLVSIWSVML